MGDQVSAGIEQLMEQAVPDSAAALRQRINHVLRDAVESLAEPARILPPAGETVHVTVSGERSIAAKTIVTAVTRDNATIQA